MPIHRDRIIEYLRQGEGAPPPVFVGRGDILTTAKDSAGQPKMTRIVQGAPGAGKSSLLHEMQKLWTGTDGTPRVVALSSTDIMDDPAVGVGAVLDAWTMDGTTWKRTLADRLERLRGIRVGPGGLSVQFSDVEVPGTLRMVAGEHPARQGAVPTVVAVDEAQRFAGDRTKPEARFLQAIHDGSTGLPLTLVLVGLSDTATRSREMNLMRDPFVHETEPMTSPQARDFMRRLALWFGLDTSRHNVCPHDLADICDGWPRRLRHAGESLGQAALDMDGDMDLMDWSQIGNETSDRRQEHYDKQYSSKMRRSRALLSTVMQEIPIQAAKKGETGLSGLDVLNLMNRVQNRYRTTGPVEWKLPKGMDAEDFLDHLTHQGAIYVTDDGNVHSSIPSFRAYLIERGSETYAEPDVRKDATNDDGPDPGPRRTGPCLMTCSSGSDLSETSRRRRAAPAHPLTDGRRVTGRPDPPSPGASPWSSAGCRSRNATSLFSTLASSDSFGMSSTVTSTAAITPMAPGTGNVPADGRAIRREGEPPRAEVSRDRTGAASGGRFPRIPTHHLVTPALAALHHFHKGWTMTVNQGSPMLRLWSHRRDRPCSLRWSTGRLRHPLEPRRHPSRNRWTSSAPTRWRIHAPPALPRPDSLPALRPPFFQPIAEPLSDPKRRKDISSQ